MTRSGGRAFSRSSALDRLAHYAVYGLFHDEPSFVLKDDLEGAAQAASVLSMIGQGTERPSEMAARLQVPQTALGRPLKRLIDLGLVSRDIPFGNDEKGNKRTLYKLSDPFLRFWYAFVLPHYSNPRFLTAAADRESIRLPFRVFLGKAWEDLVRGTLLSRELPELPVRWTKVGRWWGTGLNRSPMEVDLVAESADGKVLLVGEAKLSLMKAEARRVRAELDVKAKLLPFAARYKKVITRLFVADGGDADCVGVRWCEEPQT